MTYINKYGLPITNTIDIVSDIFDVNLSLQKNSIPLSKGIGIFNTSFSEFNTSSEDALEIQLSDFIEQNDFLVKNNVVLEPDINIESKLLYITVTIADGDSLEKRGLIFDEVF
jgi:hypothetical protein